MMTPSAMNLCDGREGMTMWKAAGALEVSDEARRTLEGWASARTSPQRMVLRARIVLLAAQGLANRRIALDVRTSRPTVLLWRNRFAAGGGAGRKAVTPQQ